MSFEVFVPHQNKPKSAIPMATIKMSGKEAIRISFNDAVIAEESITRETGKGVANKVLELLYNQDTKQIGCKFIPFEEAKPHHLQLQGRNHGLVNITEFAQRCGFYDQAKTEIRRKLTQNEGMWILSLDETSV